MIKHLAVLASTLFFLALSWGDADAGRRGYPEDPLSDVEWSAGRSGVGDIETAFNAARKNENDELGTDIPMLTLPSQAEWDALTGDEKALWLINREREDRGVAPLHGIEENVDAAAQDYAGYLAENDVFGHEEDGRTPWDRLSANPAIGACHDFLEVAENLFIFYSSGPDIPLPIPRAIYGWMYDTRGSGNWGHRHAILWDAYDDNSGPEGMEGFLGMGLASGPSGKWPLAERVVMNVFDPCETWKYPKVYDLHHVVEVLKILTGMDAAELTLEEDDVDGDGVIGLSEAMYMLGKISEMR